MSRISFSAHYPLATDHSQQFVFTLLQGWTPRSSLKINSCFYRTITHKIYTVFFKLILLFILDLNVFLLRCFCLLSPVFFKTALLKGLFEHGSRFSKPALSFWVFFFYIQAHILRNSCWLLRDLAWDVKCSQEEFCWFLKKYLVFTFKNYCLLRLLG